MTTLPDLLYVALFAVALPLWDYLVSWPAFHRQSHADPARARCHIRCSVPTDDAGSCLMLSLGLRSTHASGDSSDRNRRPQRGDGDGSTFATWRTARTSRNMCSASRGSSVGLRSCAGLTSECSVRRATRQSKISADFNDRCGGRVSVAPRANLPANTQSCDARASLARRPAKVKRRSGWRRALGHELAFNERRSTPSSRSCSTSTARRDLMRGMTRRTSFPRLKPTTASIRPSLI